LPLSKYLFDSFLPKHSEKEREREVFKDIENAESQRRRLDYLQSL